MGNIWRLKNVFPVNELLQTLRAVYEQHERSLRHLGIWVVGTYHFGVWANKRHSSLARLIGTRAYAVSTLLVELGTGCQVDRRTRIGDGLHLVHAGNIRIHPDAVIGERCHLMNDVTIGITDRPGAPRLGNDVFVGAGARILGPVTIGDRAIVAANTLVVSDVPAGATIIGVPGRPLPQPRPPRTAEAAAPAPNGEPVSPVGSAPRS